VGGSDTLVIHAEVLPAEQLACLRRLGPAAMKLLAVAQRGTKKDFVDLHALSQGLPLEVMIDCYQRRFGVTEASRVLAGLCYFDDAEAEPMPRMLAPTTWPDVKDDLRAMVRRLSRP
jgi:hypothetical protein